MTTTDPTSRPDAAQALAKWRKIRRWIFSVQRAWRVRRRDEILAQKLILDTVAFFILGPWFYGRFKACARKVFGIAGDAT